MNKVFSWHEAIFQSLLDRFRRSTLPHALLLYGEKGNASGELIQALAQALLCQQAQNSAALPCKTCQSCLLFQHQTHPDCVHLAEEGKGPIGVDAVRALFGFCSQTTSMGGAKLICIPEAHLLNKAASNALLKILEEPVGGTYFLLATHSPQMLLPTILSRVTQQHVPNPSKSELREHFSDAEPQHSGLGFERMTLAGRDDKYLTHVAQFRATLQEVMEGKIVPIKLSQSVDEALLPDFFQDVLHLIQSLMQQSLGVNREGGSPTLKSLHQSSLPCLGDHYREGLQLWQALQYNNSLNKTLLIDGFMVRLRAFYKESHVTSSSFG